MVRVGTEGTYPPFTYADPRTNQLTGYDIEVIKAVAKKAGWKLKFVQSQFDAIFPALDAKRIDVIANQVTINPERQARYLFTKPYTYCHGVIVTAADNKDIKTLEDLKGKTTAQSATSNWAQVAKDAGAKVENVEGFAQAAALLGQGRVDAIVNDNIAVLDYLASTGSKKIKIAGNAGTRSASRHSPSASPTPPCATRRTRRWPQLRDDGTLSEDLREVLRGRRLRRDVRQGEGQRLGHRAQHWQVLKDKAWPMLRGLIRGPSR